MTSRVEFLAALRAGLRGAPAALIEEFVADYAAHFDEGAAANRRETDIASALGDPLLLAGELRTELRIEAFEAAPSPRSAARLIASAVAAGLLSIVLLCVAAPLLAMITLGTLAGILAAVAAGVWMLFDGASLGLPGGIATTVLCALGLFSAAVFGSAVLILAGKFLIDGIAHCARRRYRLLITKPGTGKNP